MIPSHMSYSAASLAMPQALGKNATVAETREAKLRETVREIEATFLSLVLKEMRQSLEPDTMFPGDSGDVQGGLFDLFLSKHMADTGGVGVAQALLRQMKPVGETRGNTPSHVSTTGSIVDSTPANGSIVG